MSTLTTDRIDLVAKHRNDKGKPENAPARDRIDIRADPAMVARIQRQADRFGISLTAYIKLAVALKLEADEGTCSHHESA